MMMDALILSHVTLDGCPVCLRSKERREVNAGHQLAVVTQLMRAAVVAAVPVA